MSSYMLSDQAPKNMCLQQSTPWIINEPFLISKHGWNHLRSLCAHAHLTVSPTDSSSFGPGTRYGFGSSLPRSINARRRNKSF